MKKTQKNVTRIARKDKTETCTNRLKVKRNFKVKSLDEQHEISKKKSYKNCTHLSRMLLRPGVSK